MTPQDEKIIEEIRELRILYKNATPVSGIDKWYRDTIDFLLTALDEARKELKSEQEVSQQHCADSIKLQSNLDEARKEIKQKQTIIEFGIEPAMKTRIISIEYKLGLCEQELKKVRHEANAWANDFRECDLELSEVNIKLSVSEEELKKHCGCKIAEEAICPEHLKLVSKLEASEELAKELGEALENLMLGPESFYEEIVNNHSCIKALAKFKEKK